MTANGHSDSDPPPGGDDGGVLEPMTIREIVGRNVLRMRMEAGVEHDDVSRAALAYDLEWSRTWLVGLERGNKAISAEQLIALPIVLSDALGYKVGLADLFYGDEPVRLGKSPQSEAAHLPLAKIREVITALPYRRVFSGPSLTSSAQTTDAVTRAAKKMREISRAGLGDLDSRALARAEAGAGELEEKLARRLGVAPIVVIAAAAGLWGHSATEEHAKRLANEGDGEGEVPQRVRNAVMRKLTTELTERLVQAEAAAKEATQRAAEAAEIKRVAALPTQVLPAITPRSPVPDDVPQWTPGGPRFDSAAPTMWRSHDEPPSASPQPDADPLFSQDTGAARYADHPDHPDPLKIRDGDALISRDADPLISRDTDVATHADHPDHPDPLTSHDADALLSPGADPLFSRDADALLSLETWRPSQPADAAEQPLGSNLDVGHEPSRSWASGARPAPWETEEPPIARELNGVLGLRDALMPNGLREYELFADLPASGSAADHSASRGFALDDPVPSHDSPPLAGGLGTNLDGVPGAVRNNPVLDGRAALADAAPDDGRPTLADAALDNGRPKLAGGGTTGARGQRSSQARHGRKPSRGKKAATLPPDELPLTTPDELPPDDPAVPGSTGSDLSVAG